MQLLRSLSGQLREGGNMVTINKCIDVDIDVEVNMEDFTDEEIIEEVQLRDLALIFHNDTVDQLYWAYTGKNQKLVDELIRELFYQELGKIVV